MLRYAPTALRRMATNAESQFRPPLRAHTRTLKFNRIFSTQSFHTYGSFSGSDPIARAQSEDIASTLYQMSAKKNARFSTAAVENYAYTNHELIGELRILLLTNSFNSMAQRAYLEITDTYGSNVNIELAIDKKQMIDSVKRHDPDIILCPFLTKRIPEEIWRDTSRLCLVVHPGIHGDRGASSIDWALKDMHPEWGVTILQADEEMDAGDIWSTKPFLVPQDITKSSMYGSVVIDTTMDAIHEVLEKFVTGGSGIPLDYSDPSVKGTLRGNMKIADRGIDFDDSAKSVASAIRLSDSSPGAPHTIGGHDVFLYDAHVDDAVLPPGTKPGKLIEKSNGAVRIACTRGSVWVTHMKARSKDCVLPRIKLPCTDILPKELTHHLPEHSEPNLILENERMKPKAAGWQDMWASVSESGTAVIHFNFLNGAMSTNQCQRLTSFLQDVSVQDDVKAIVLAGGQSVWSNGINLNTIEASSDPAKESWENINAINDLVKAIFSTTKVTIAALQGNAGAGGIMAAIACDYVWTHGNAVLNPHYKSMGLHGSEYWTYFLPKRVGHKTAHRLTENCMPVSAKTAKALGIIDAVLTEDRASFMDMVHIRSDSLVSNKTLLQTIQSKKEEQRTDEWYRLLERMREHELRIMRENFVNKEYIQARKNFVYKQSPTSTPLHLILDQYRPHVLQANNGVALGAQSFSKATKMDGSKVAELRLEKLTEDVETLKKSGTPKLDVIIVDGYADSERYVNQKAKTAERVGIATEVHRFKQSDFSTKQLEEQLIDRIHHLNKSKSTHGVMVQLPLPPSVDKYKVLAAVSPHKDVDGFAAANIGSICGGFKETEAPLFAACTAKGIMALLDHYGVQITGKNVAVIGRSRVVGLPTQLFLMDRGATVTNCDINTKGLRKIIQSSDIVIASAGSPELVKANWIKPGAVVVDVGFHVIDEWCDKQEKTVQRILGDVHTDVHHVASLVTPVPRGVGPMTVAMLLENTVDAFKWQQQKK